MTFYLESISLSISSCGRERSFTITGATFLTMSVVCSWVLIDAPGYHDFVGPHLEVDPKLIEICTDLVLARLPL